MHSGVTVMSRLQYAAQCLPLAALPLRHAGTAATVRLARRTFEVCGVETSPPHTGQRPDQGQHLCAGEDLELEGSRCTRASAVAVCRLPSGQRARCEDARMGWEAIMSLDTETMPHTIQAASRTPMPVSAPHSSTYRHVYLQRRAAAEGSTWTRSETARLVQPAARVPTTSPVRYSTSHIPRRPPTSDRAGQTNI